MPIHREIMLVFPGRGIDVTKEFSLQPEGTTPAGVNVRARDPFAQRGRGGSRPGLSRWIDDQLTGGSATVQDLTVVVTDVAEALLYNYLPEPGTPLIENPQIPGTYVPVGGSGVQPNPDVTQVSNPDPVPNWFIATVNTDSGGGVYNVSFAGGGPATSITVDGAPVIPEGATVLLIKRNGTYAVQPINWLAGE